MRIPIEQMTFIFMLLGSLLLVPFSEAAPVKAAYVESDLVSDQKTISPGEKFWVGLSMKMESPWHTYWRNSGDSGLPTEITWDLPAGFKAGEIQWPYPKKVDYDSGLTSYIYEGDVILLAEITPPTDLSTGTTIEIKAKVKWLACHDICVPGQAEHKLDLSLMEGAAEVDQKIDSMFEDEQKKWPRENTDWDFTVFELEDKFVLRLLPIVKNSTKLSRIQFFPYANDIIAHSLAQELTNKGRGYELHIVKSVLANGENEKFEGVLVNENGWRGKDLTKALAISLPIFH